MSVCDFLFSADMCVASTGETLDRLLAGLGAYVRYEENGWDVVFALVNKAFAAAPTRLEIIAPLDPPGTSPGREGLRVYARQAPRLWRTHATVVATPDIEAVVESVRRAGARHWYQPPAREVSFPRLWMGAADGDLGDYDRTADAGLMFEFIPSDSSAFSPKLFQPVVDEPRPGETGFRRIRSRAFLTADLDADLRHLETVFGWSPAHAVRDEPERGYRYADMSANHAHGATLRLVQATNPDGKAGRDFAAQGAGPYTITIAAYDLDATAADLTERGLAHHRMPSGRWEPEALIPDADLGAPIAIVPDTPLG
jgi:hypothetical protein